MQNDDSMNLTELCEVAQFGFEWANNGKDIYKIGKMILDEKETDEGKSQAMLFFGILGAIAKRKEQLEKKNSRL